MSRGQGLHSWTVRDLAAALDVAPSVIYHHIGGRDLIVRGVVEQILEEAPRPDPGLEWDDWFRALLFPLRPVLQQFPGTAKWLLMHGPSFPAVSGVFDAGIATLTRAGFEYPALVYALVVNSAMLTISMGDERLEQADDGPRDHATMLREFSQVSTASPGFTRMIDEVIRPLADSGPSAAAINESYYRLLVESLLIGVAAQRRAR